MLNNKREYDRLVELQLLQDKAINLMKSNVEFSKWLQQHTKDHKVDKTLLQYLYDMKDQQISLSRTLAAFIEREYESESGVKN